MLTPEQSRELILAYREDVKAILADRYVAPKPHPCMGEMYEPDSNRGFALIHAKKRQSAAK